MFDEYFFKNIWQKKHAKFTVDKLHITWDMIVENLNLCIRENKEIKVLDNFGFVLHDTICQDLTDVVDIGLQLGKTFKPEPISAHYYVSMSEESKTFGMHKDNSCVFLCQAIGSTKVTVVDENEISYNLEVGDVLYIPRGMYHNTQPLTPRVNVSFGIDYEN